MLPLPEEEKRFSKSLETGKPYTTYALGNEFRTSVKAMGRLSASQFTMMVRPSDYSNSWLDMDEPYEVPPGHVQGPKFQADHPAYKELEEQIMKEGVRRPVIVGSKQDMILPGVPGNENRLVRTPAHPLLDGHHRAFFAVKHGLEIPVSVFKGRR